MARKLFMLGGYSAAIRQWRATHSKCCMLHGYFFKFHVTFEANELNELNWVADFGCFKRTGLTEWLDYMFDHTTLVEENDPMLEYFKMMQVEKIADIRIMDKMGCESLAKLVFDKFNDTFSKQEGGRIKVVRVECFEHEKNSAIYTEL